MSQPIDKRECIIKEVITTEESFNTNLKNCLEILINPLLDALKERKLSVSDDSFVEMLKKCSVVYQKSSEFCRSLQIKNSDGSFRITEMMSTFPVLAVDYCDYIKSFHKLSPVLRKQRNSNKALNEFCEKREEILKDSLGSVLIQPMQRPMRYRLLLQELIKNTPQDDEHYTFLQQTLQTLRATISQIDEKIERFDEWIIMQELQAKIVDFDVTEIPDRRLYFHGPCVKFSRKWTNDRYIAIFSDVLLVAEPSMSSYKVNKLYKSGGYNIVAVDDHEPFFNAVDIRQQKKSFRVNMRNLQDKNGVLEGFEKMKTEKKITQESLENKGFAPVWIPDDQAPLCMSCNVKFSFVVRRHHCRYCGDCICSKCFKHKIVCPGLGDQPQSVCSKCFIKIHDSKKESE